MATRTAHPVIAQLAAERVRRGLTQLAVAHRVGTSRPVICRLESGERQPTLDTLSRYAQALGYALTVTTATPQEVSTP